MENPWKLTTIGLVVTAVTALTSGLTTAYLLRTAPPPASVDAGRPPATLARLTASERTVPDVEEPRRPPIVSVTRTPVAPSVRRASYEPTAVPAPVAHEPAAGPAPVAPAPAGRPVAHEPAATPATVTPPAVAAPRSETASPSVPADRPVPQSVAASTAGAASTTAAAAPSDCATGGDRAWRIAKPGALGTALGAGVGAIGGAIADGGKGAGKGALWGGLAGAAAGTAWGAYKTKQECGTIFGAPTPANGVAAPSARVPDTPGPGATGGAEVPQAPFAPARATPENDGITIYNAR